MALLVIVRSNVVFASVCWVNAEYSTLSKLSFPLGQVEVDMFTL
jgi:hypothetical protein